MPGPADILGRLADRTLALASKASPWTARFAGGRLARQRRLRDAEALLARATVAFPRHAGVRARYAFVAQAAERYAEAAVRWSEACALAPGNATAWCGRAHAERLLGNLDVATDAVARALALRPNDPGILLEAARIHDRADRPDVAIEFWSRLVRQRGDDPVLRQGCADCLIRLHRLEEAKRQIENGLSRNPGHRGLAASKGLLAMRREDWDAAFEIWSAYVSAYPDDALGRTFLLRVESVRQLAAASRRETLPPLRAPIDVVRVEDEALRALMLQFEGIGTDCEFGTVQRRYGAEPLGLLRWNDVDFQTLAAALGERFARMGEPEMTELYTDHLGLLYVRDRRWNLGMHTFLFEREVSRDSLFPKMCRRVVFLRDKFLADLETAAKVLVFKTDDLSFEELSQLHELLRLHGPVNLLHVRSAGWAGVPPWPEGAAGTVSMIAPGLLVGYVKWIGDLERTPYDDWVEICRATLDLFARVPATAGVRVTS